MDGRIEFWFDFSSNYSYISAMRIESAAAGRGVGVAWVPFLLGPIFASFGWPTSPFVLQKEKGAYVWRDMERQCAKHGIAFKRPSEFPRPATLPMRIAAAHAGRDWMPAFCKAIMSMNFGHDRAVNGAESSESVLRSLGVDARQVMVEAESQAGRSALRRNTNDARARGIFGAPTFFAGTEMFWGDDRLEDALEYASLRRAR